MLRDNEIEQLLVEKAILQDTNGPKVDHAKIIIRTIEKIIADVQVSSDEEGVLDVLKEHIYPELLQVSSLSKSEQAKLMNIYTEYLISVCKLSVEARIKMLHTTFATSRRLQNYLSEVASITDSDEEKASQAERTFRRQVRLPYGRRFESVGKNGKALKGQAQVVVGRSAPVLKRTTSQRRKQEDNKTYAILTRFGQTEAYRSELKPGVASLVQDANGKILLVRPEDETVAVRDLILTSVAVVRAKNKLRRETKRQLLDEQGDIIIKNVPVGLTVPSDQEQTTMSEIDAAMKARAASMRLLRRFEDPIAMYFEKRILYILPEYVELAREVKPRLVIREIDGEFRTSYRWLLRAKVSGRSRLYRKGIVFVDPETKQDTLIGPVIAKMRSDIKTGTAVARKQRQIVERELKPYTTAAELLLKEVNDDYYQRCSDAQASSFNRVAVRLRSKVVITDDEDSFSFPNLGQIVPKRAEYNPILKRWDLTDGCNDITTAKNFNSGVDDEFKEKLQNLDRRKRKLPAKGIYKEVKLKRPLNLDELSLLSRHSDYNPFDEIVVNHSKDPLAVYNESRMINLERTAETEAEVSANTKKALRVYDFGPLKYLYLVSDIDKSSKIIQLIDTYGCQWLPISVEDSDVPLENMSDLGRTKSGRLFLDTHRRLCLFTNRPISRTINVVGRPLGVTAVVLALRNGNLNLRMDIGVVSAITDGIEYNPLYAPFDENTKEKIYSVDFTEQPMKYRSRFHGICKSTQDELVADYCNVYYPYPEMEDGCSYFPQNNVLGNMFWRRYGPCQNYSWRANMDKLASSRCTKILRDEIKNEFLDQKESLAEQTRLSNTKKTVVDMPYKSLEHPFSDCLKRITIRDLALTQESAGLYFHVELPVRIGISALSASLIQKYYTETPNKERANPAFLPYLTNASERIITASLVFQSGVFYLAASQRLLHIWSVVNTEQLFSFDFNESMTKRQRRFIEQIFGSKAAQNASDPCETSPEVFSASFYRLKREEEEPIFDPFELTSQYGELAKYESIVNREVVNFADYLAMKQNRDLIKYRNELCAYLTPGMEVIYEARERIEKLRVQDEVRGERYLRTVVETLTPERMRIHATSIIEAHQSMEYPSKAFEVRYHWAVEYMKQITPVVRKFEIDQDEPEDVHGKNKQRKQEDVHGKNKQRKHRRRDNSDSDNSNSDEDSYESYESDYETDSEEDSEEERRKEERATAKRERKINFKDIAGSVSDFMYIDQEQRIFGRINCPELYNNQSKEIRLLIENEFKDLDRNKAAIMAPGGLPKLLLPSVVNLYFGRFKSTQPGDWDTLKLDLLTKEDVKLIKAAGEITMVFAVRKLFQKLKNLQIQTGPVSPKLAVIIPGITSGKLVLKEYDSKMEKLVNTLIEGKNLLDQCLQFQLDIHAKKYLAADKDLCSNSTGRKNRTEDVKALWRLAELRIRASIDYAEWLFVQRHLGTYILKLVGTYYKLSTTTEEQQLEMLMSAYLFSDCDKLTHLLN